MKDFNKEEYNKMCADFLELTEHIPNEERRKWNDKCYPDLPYYRLEYNVPIQFGHDYVTPTVLHVLYYDADKIPRPTEKIAVAKMKFHSDWNWIIQVYHKIIDKHTAIFLPKNGIESITPYVNESSRVRRSLMHGEREAVVQAIWEFLNWHKENKK